MDFENEIHFQNVAHVQTVDHDNQFIPVASHKSGKRKPGEVFVMSGQQSK
jgi:hypothetical protein